LGSLAHEFTNLIYYTPSIQWVKRLGCEADHSPPSSAEVKNAYSYTFTPPPIRLHVVVLN